MVLSMLLNVRSSDVSNVTIILSTIIYFDFHKTEIFSLSKIFKQLFSS
jgi:hypothetical protein